MESSKKRKLKDGESVKVKKSKSKSNVGKQAVEVETVAKDEDVPVDQVISAPAAASTSQGVTSDPIATDATDAADAADTEPSRKRSKKAPDADPALPEIEIDTEAPTPLSKAQLRAARKEAKAAAKAGKDVPADGEAAGAAGTPAKAKTKKEKKDKKPTKINSIWIGNMSFRTQADTLRSWMERNIRSLAESDESTREAIEDAEKRIKRREEKRVEKRAEREAEAKKEGKEVRPRKAMDGESGSEAGSWITRVNLPLKPGKGKLSDNKGFAYVDFLTPALQTAALRLSERLLEGRKLLIKLGDDHAAAPDTRTPKPPTIVAGALPRKQPHDASSSLFMGNLDFAATEEEIRDMVEGNAIRAALGGGNAKGGKRKRRDESEGEEEESEDGSSDEEEDSDEEDEDADEAEEAEEKPEAGVAPKGANATKPRGGTVSNLVKVRVGQFEDTGRCKGFAFLDFKTVEAATFALANRANHFMRGRKLTLQYASQSATMRSSRAKRVAHEGPRDGETAEGGEDADDSTRKPFARRPRPDGDAAEPASVLSNYTRSKGGPRDGERPARPSFGGSGKDRSNDTRGRKWEAAGRPRPGAALAMAKRENVAIVAGAGGKKTTFD